MATIVSAIGDLFSMVMTQLGTLCTAIVGSPILLLFVVLGLVGLAVGFFHRLTR